MVDDADSFLTVPGQIEFRPAVESVDKTWWREVFGEETPLQVLRQVAKSMPGRHEARFAIDGLQQRFVLDITGRQANAEIWFNYARFDLREMRFYEDGIRIDDKFRGAGHAQRLVGNLADLADRLRVSKIALSTEHVGGYMWARAGAVPVGKTAELRDDLKKRLRRAAIRTRFEPHRLEQVSKLIDAIDTNPKAIWGVANLPDLVEAAEGRPLNGDRTWALGKELLTGCEWDGEIALDDPIARGVFETWREKWQIAERVTEIKKGRSTSEVSGPGSP